LRVRFWPGLSESRLGAQRGRVTMVVRMVVTMVVRMVVRMVWIVKMGTCGVCMSRC